METTVNNSLLTVNCIEYIWGKDLSGTFQGAGGIAALLAVRKNATWYFPFYDHNGNITDYLSATGTPAAHYEYDPFGNTIAQSGSMSNAFRYRFSTKYHDPEPDLYYYGSRFYNPVFKRWLNRDPQEEKGGVNLYTFCENDPINGVDYLGLWKIERKGEAWAIATPEKGDTFLGLAFKVELDVEDYKDWAHTPHEQSKIGCTYKIPNTIYYHHGVFGFFDYFGLLGETRARNRKYSMTDRAKGFKVVWVNKNVTPETMRNALQDEYLYRYTFAGHGYLQKDEGSLQGLNNRAITPGRWTNHGINSLKLYACNSAVKMEYAGNKKYYQYNSWEWNVAKKGWFVGYEGKTTSVTELPRLRNIRGNNRKGVLP